MSEEVQHAEQEISNEQQQLEQQYREHYEFLQHHFAEVVKTMENEANLNKKLTTDLVFYRNQSQAAMRNEAKAVKRAEKMEAQLERMNVRLKKLERLESLYGFRGILKKCQMPELVKEKIRHKIGKLTLLNTNNRSRF